MNVREIAAKRGWQTLVDVAIAAAVIEAGMVLLAALGTWESWNDVVVAAPTITFALAKAAITATLGAVLAYMRRRYVDHSGIEPEVETVAPRRALVE